MRVTIYGGSFDPPHIAHVAVIDEILESIAPDVLIVLISFANPMKPPPLFDAKKRVLWMNALCENKSNFKTQVIVSDIDIQNRITNTIDSVEILKKTYKNAEFDVVIGSDYADSLHLWEGYDELAKQVRFIMVERVGHTKTPQFKVAQILKINIDEKILSTRIREQLLEHNCAPCVPEKIKASVFEASKDQDR